MARDYSINVSQLVRDWLATQDGPRSAKQIRAALGLSGNSLGRRIGVMVESGVLVKHGAWPHALYSLGREARRSMRYSTDEERLAAKRETQRQYRERKRGGRPPRKYGDAKPAPKPKPKPAPKVVVRLKPAPPKQPEPARVESIDEWMRRTGKKPERLHPAECSHPLKRIGWQPTKRKAA